MKAIVLAVVGWVLASCDAANTNNAAQAQQQLERPKASIMIRTMAGGSEQEAYLVEPIRDVPLDRLADAVRETGSRCEAVTAFNQLEQNGQRLDVYKVECGSLSYQLTVLEGSTHIKKWTGNIFG
jgi:hypothetical protein